MVEKYLFLGSGSDKDPGFDDVSIGDVPYKEFMKSKGITVIDKMIESCHGCYDIMKDYSQQMQFLANNGARVVAVLQGGLLFGLPSIQATQTTFPIISHPLDLVAYSAFMVPSGHAVVASVGVDDEKKEERTKALTLAERILNLENPSVNVYASKENYEKLKEKFGQSMNVIPGSTSNDALSLVYGTEEEMKNVPSMQVRGLDNLVIFATKILSLQNPGLMASIKEIGRKKLNTYKQRDLLVGTEAAIKNGR